MISVIVPVYNVEQYLERCIRSIIGQTYHDIEIILVDDGSTDGSGEICDRYASQDARVSSFHKENGGLSSARNYGVRVAHGEFITFIDSDDCINENYISTLAEGCTEKDISICFNSKIWDLEEPDMKREQPEGNVETISSKEALYRFFHENNYVSAWGKLYPAAFFEDIEFPTGRIYEDYATTYKAYAKAERILVHHVKYYYYTMRSNSITGQAFSEKNWDMLKAYDEVQAYLLENAFDEKMHNAFCGSKIKGLLFLYYKIMISKDCKLYDEKLMELKSVIMKSKSKVLCSKDVDFKIKIALTVFLLNKKLFVFCMNKMR